MVLQKRGVTLSSVLHSFLIAAEERVEQERKAAERKDVEEEQIAAEKRNEESRLHLKVGCWDAKGFFGMLKA